MNKPCRANARLTQAQYDKLLILAEHNGRPNVSRWIADRIDRAVLPKRRKK